MEDIQLLKKKIARLNKARIQAEQILEQKALELWESKQELEIKVKERTQELQIAKDRAEKSQLAEKIFLANMSHEIRTPLNAIIGMAHVLADTELHEEQKDFLNTLISSANILQDLISDILDISKIDSGKISVINSDFDLVEFLEVLESIFKPQAETKGLIFNLELDNKIKTSLHGDTKLLNHVLINLLGNALKFTETGSLTLSVKLTSIEKENQYLTFKCIDTGIGIDEEGQKKIFSEFIQANKSIDRKYGGTGLGLSISRKIINLLHGDLKVISKKGVGSTFYFTIPLIIAKGIRRKEAVPVPSESETMSISHVLIAEDNTFNQMYLKNVLKKWDISFEVADDGKKAFDLFKTTKFDLILMDIQMPNMDGYDATNNIRNLDQDIPIIALTANSFADDREKAEQVGFSDFLSKPYNPDQLKKMLVKYSQSTSF